MGMPAHGFLLFHLLIMIVSSAPVECLFIDDGHVVHDAFVIVRDGFEAAFAFRAQGAAVHFFEFAFLSRPFAQVSAAFVIDIQHIGRIFRSIHRPSAFQRLEIKALFLRTFWRSREDTEGVHTEDIAVLAVNPCAVRHAVVFIVEIVCSIFLDRLQVAAGIDFSFGIVERDAHFFCLTAFLDLKTVLFFAMPASQIAVALFGNLRLFHHAFKRIGRRFGGSFPQVERPMHRTSDRTRAIGFFAYFIFLPP